MNNALSYSFFFFLGLAIGSFLNVLIYRLPQNLSIFGRSFCPACRKQIYWYDNIPIASFVILKGQCRHCHSSIGWQYPVVELMTGALFVLTVIVIPHQNLSSIIYHLFIVSSLIVIFFTDLKYGIIPDKIVYPAILVSSLFSLAFTSEEVGSIFNYIYSALGASALFLLLILITKGRGMGLGDVKLAFLMGLFLGWPNIVIAIYSAFILGGLVSIVLLVKRLKKIGQTIPFGPFLVTGTLIAFFLT